MADKPAPVDWDEVDKARKDFLSGQAQPPKPLPKKELTTTKDKQPE